MAREQDPDPRWQTAIAHPELQTLDAPVTLVCHFCGQAARYAYLHGERRRNGWLAWIRCCFCGQRDPYFVTRP